MTISNVTRLMIKSEVMRLSIQTQVRSCNSSLASLIYPFAFVTLPSISQTKIEWDLDTALREREKKKRN